MSAMMHVWVKSSCGTWAWTMRFLGQIEGPVGFLQHTGWIPIESQQDLKSFVRTESCQASQWLASHHNFYGLTHTHTHQQKSTGQNVKNC